MGRKLSTYESETGEGFCEVHFNFKEEYAYIKYFDENARNFYTEEYLNTPIAEVNSLARKWAEGYYTFSI